MTSYYDDLNRIKPVEYHEPEGTDPLEELYED